ncbi:MAG: AMP-binding protein [Acetobacteraceae bacterium]|nr:AMP-binding protein [Acetobacteraceae bacterium]MBV8591054.1 AMP-binding protein [Acetobacteraceae bacterium]
MTSRSMLASFSDHAARRAQATALVWQDERISYSELYEMAARAASELRALDLPRSQPVGLLAEKSPSAIALILGCLMAGHCFVLPSFELASATHEILFERASCSAILSPETGTKVGSMRFATKIIDTRASGTGLARAIEAGDIAVMLTTSGSTGLPKLVPLPMRGIERFMDWACDKFGIGPGKTVLNYAPLNFDLCFLDVWATLKGGGCVALVDRRHATNGTQLLRLLSTADVQVIQAVPMFYRLLIEAAKPSGVRFKGVQHVIFTGDSMPGACLEALPTLFPAAAFYNIYGCTETNDSFIHEADLSSPFAGRVPIGQPLPGVEAAILDENGAVIEGSGVGELVVLTPFQTRGYIGDDLNEGKFLSLIRGSSVQAYFRSGDLVQRHEDGSITLEGRKDFHVKVRGNRVNMQEVERIILDHADVIEGAVVALPDQLAGNRLQASVRRRPRSGLNSLHLFQHCARSLARAAIPSSFTVGDSPLPKTSTGKIDRQQIRQLYLKGEHHA